MTAKPNLSIVENVLSILLTDAIGNRREDFCGSFEITDLLILAATVLARKGGGAVIRGLRTLQQYLRFIIRVLVRGVKVPHSTRPAQRGLIPGLVLLTTVTSVVSSLGAPLVPAIARHEGVSLTAAQWSLTSTLLVGAVATPILGRLAGRHRRPVVLGGLTAVTAGLLACALPLGFMCLLVGRALQGIGIALIPLAIAIARDSLPAARSGSTIGLLSVTTVAGSGLGYPLAAVVAEHAGIAAAYWLGFALCCGTIAVVRGIVPEADSRDAGPVDWWGALALAAGTSGLLLALGQGGSWGWASWQATLLFGTSVCVLTGWVRRTLRVAHPLVDLRLAWGQGAMGANIIAVTSGVGVYLLLSLTMIATQAPAHGGFGLGRSIVGAGLLLLPYSVLTVAGSRVALVLSRRIRSDFVLPVGCALYATAAVSLALFHETYWELLLGMALAGLGGGTTFAMIPKLLIRDLPPSETGSAIAFNMLLRFLGFSAGSALAPALIDVFAGTGPPSSATFTAVAAVGAGLWITSGLISTLTARLVVRTAPLSASLGSLR